MTEYLVSGAAEAMMPGDVMIKLDGGWLAMLTRADAALYTVAGGRWIERARLPRRGDDTVRHDRLVAWLQEWRLRTLALDQVPLELRDRVVLEVNRRLDGPQYRAVLVGADGVMALAGVWLATPDEAVRNLVAVADLEEISARIAEEVFNRPPAALDE